MTCASLLLLAGVVVGTWNGEWFPSGRAEHRASEKAEAATIRAAGKMLRGGIAAVDPEGTNDVIICLNEIRDRETAEALVKAIGRKGLSVAAISAYRRRDRFDQQQDVILTTLPVASANWSLWKTSRKNPVPPRGYVRAEVVLSPAVTSTVYAVHLKSNYGATTDEIKAANTAKRTAAIGQLVAQEKPKGKAKKAPPVIIAGDFNADRWDDDFASEKIFGILDEGGFADVLALAPEDGRGTCPDKRWGDSAYDYIMVRGVRRITPPVVVSSEALSDHNAVFTVISP